MIRAVLVAILLLAVVPARAQDQDLRAAVDPALQQCIEAVNDTRLSDDGSGDLPSLSECIGAGTNACQEEPGGASTQGMSACNEAEQAFWDDLLNYAYTSLRDSLEPEIFSALQAAQQAWIPWRDARCNFVYENAKDGTISQVLTSFCLAETTAQRAIDLMQVMDGYAG